MDESNWSGGGDDGVFGCGVISIPFLRKPISPNEYMSIIKLFAYYNIQIWASHYNRIQLLLYYNIER